MRNAVVRGQSSCPVLAEHTRPRRRYDNVHDAVRGEARREEAQYRALPALPPRRYEYAVRAQERGRHRSFVRYPSLGRRVRVAQGL